ncbi:MAG: nucleotidyltransferase family protein [Neisseriaceae bacterium]|nr:nucleotidyltransferase family protein [Neisseriaceae bacterium]
MSSPHHAIVGLVLAAGLGSRYAQTCGGCKLIHPLPPHGQPVVQRSTSVLASACDTTYVITGHWQAEVLQALRADPKLKAQPLHCPDYARGMGQSIKTAIAQTHPTLGWLVSLGDMPYIQPHTSQKMAQALQQGALLARPLYQGRPGHPVAFSHQLRTALLAIDDANGASSVLKTWAADLLCIEVDDPGCVRDLDTIQDLLPSIMIG